MRKPFLVLVVLVVSLSLILASCGESETSPTAPAGQYGGHLRIITGAGGSPQNIGYSAKQQFGDATVGTIYAERILNLKTNGDFAPNLAESYEMSSDLKTITIHLRTGVKFQDGTDCDADAVVWNLKTCWESGALAGGKRIDSIEATDDHTIVVKLNVPNNQVIYDLARVYIYSPTAFEQNGEEWAITHSVSTASLMVTDFQRDIVVKMKKFDDYWREGLPYLDSAELITVAEPSTASIMMQAGQADVWMGVPAQEAAELKAMGFKTLETPTTYNNLYCDSANPDSPFANKLVREAIEYAIDRDAMAEALGFGFQRAVNQMAHEGTAGYNPNYAGRPYNVEKAKQLMRDAGFSQGISTTLMVGPTGANAGAIIKDFLAEIGIQVEIDVADIGRFWGAINGGWTGLLLGPSAVNPEYCVAWLHHFGPEPIMKFASMAKSAEYLALCDELVEAPDIPTMRQLTMEMCTQAAEDAMYIPLTLNIGVTVIADNFHTSYYQDLDWTYWSIWDDWLE